MRAQIAESFTFQSFPCFVQECVFIRRLSLVSIFYTAVYGIDYTVDYTVQTILFRIRGLVYRLQWTAPESDRKGRRSKIQADGNKKNLKKSVWQHGKFFISENSSNPRSLLNKNSTAQVLHRYLTVRISNLLLYLWCWQRPNIPIIILESLLVQLF